MGVCGRCLGRATGLSGPGTPIFTSKLMFIHIMEMECVDVVLKISLATSVHFFLFVGSLQGPDGGSSFLAYTIQVERTEHAP